MQQTRWDDIRQFLALAEHGTVREAARSLSVSHPTVSRRLAALEQQLGVDLVRRFEGKYTTTEEGALAFETAVQIRDLIQTLERRIAGRAAQVVGPIRVAVGSVLGDLLHGVFADFCRDYPGVRLLVESGDRLADVQRGEADVAIRFSFSALPDQLIGRRICDARVAPYASRAYLARNAGLSLTEYDWVSLDERFAGDPLTDWITQNVPQERVRLQLGDARPLLGAVVESMGAGFISCMVADPHPELVRLDGPTQTYPLWLLTHEDLRKSERIRAFFDHLARSLESMREQMEGSAKA
ncbi:MAG: LysR family transcriptional regulator [Proteobacteria bacterium]|nr:LysR family transcriptional regulator [Pseudomonadota bacterium]